MIKTGLASLLLSVFAAGTAWAAVGPIVYDSSPNSQARQIVNVVFAEYLQQRVGIVVETAVMDLDSDKTGEVFARFVHTGSCSAGLKECRTVILKYLNGKWAIALDRPTAKIAVLEADTRAPSNLKIDQFTWTWSGRAYAPSSDGLGGKLAFKAVPKANVMVMAPAFGQGASKLAQAGQDVKFEYAKPEITSKGETLLVRMSGNTICGYVAGCPIRLLQKDGDKWKSVLSAQSKGGISVSDVSRGGYRDLILETGNGLAVLGWNGSSYTVADRVEEVQGE